MFEAFENNLYTLGLFIDLSKGFDPADHTILFEKFELYDIRGNHRNWIKSFLSTRKQCIEIETHDKSQFGTCEVWSSSKINISTTFTSCICQ